MSLCKQKTFGPLGVETCTQKKLTLVNVIEHALHVSKLDLGSITITLWLPGCSVLIKLLMWKK